MPAQPVGNGCKKTLMGVSRICSAGHKLALRRDGGSNLASGQASKFHREDMCLPSQGQNRLGGLGVQQAGAQESTEIRAPAGPSGHEALL